ncbi:DNA polymerase V [Onishia taeanensis]|uniref:DNA polymerase V n=1 Tax=Onishia taeanensis TaxID=284577 RepID=A0A328Y0E0_9GAMM|nr:Y-family DNA polymerase [Halomonas taeanensis]RAR64284.1 DNA polymerase V [Halomonas taeanensis]
MIALVDCNNFYVSCERVFDPRLEGRQVGVLSNNDSCIVARSSELKSQGVEMGAAMHLLPPHVRHQAVLLSSNYALYGDMSRRVTQILGEFSPHIEVYSIDESFVGFQGFDPSTLEEHSHQLRRTVLKWTGIPVSVGIAQTRVLAKVANRAAKMNPAYEGVCMLDADNGHTTRSLLQNLPVTELWGVARRTGERLAVMGIETAWQLREADPKRIRRAFSVVLERIVWELRGQPAITLDDMAAPKRQIMVSRSFGRLTSDPTDLREAVRQHAARAGEKLRRQGSVAKAVMVFVRTNPFQPSQPQYRNSAVVPLAQPCNDTRDIAQAAARGLDIVFLEGYRYQKVGVMLLDISDEANRQLSLGETTQSEGERKRRQNLMATVDILNRELGRDKVRLGLPRQENSWRLKCEKRSPRYTTRWEELVVVKS